MIDERTEFWDGYFSWLCETVCGDRYSRAISYAKLLSDLHSHEFIFYIPRDENRAKDGIDLRRRYACGWDGYYMRYESDYELSRSGLYDAPCSVLEMMIALAIRCEESIMDDSRVGDRTGQWFWEMIVSLGLGSMNDDDYDPEYVHYTIERFIEREYEPNGKGGLFTIYNCDRDLRKVEIWYQLCWYLDSIV